MLEVREVPTDQWPLLEMTERDFLFNEILRELLRVKRTVFGVPSLPRIWPPVDELPKEQRS